MIEWWGQNFVKPKTCYILIRKFSIWEYASLKTLETYTCCILMRFSVFSFSVIAKPRRLAYSVFSSIISSQRLLALQQVLFPFPITAISINITLT